METLDKECKDAEHVVQSAFYASLPDSERTRLREQYEALIARRNNAEREYQATKLELVSADSWPTGPPSSALAEDDMRQKQNEIANYLKELTSIVQEMQKVFGDIQKFNAPSQLLPGDENGEEGTAMDVDEDTKASSSSSGLPGRKRRRMDDGSRADAGGPSQEEINQFISGLQDLEEKMASLKNDITAHDQEARDELDNMISTKIEENNIRNAELVREREEKRQTEEKFRNDVLDMLSQEVQKAGKDVGEIATAVGDVVIRATDLEIALVEEKKERETALSRLTAVCLLIPSHVFLYHSISNPRFFLFLSG